MMRLGPSAKMMGAFVTRATTNKSTGLMRHRGALAVRFMTAAPPGPKVRCIIYLSAVVVAVQVSIICLLIARLFTVFLSN